MADPKAEPAQGQTLDIGASLVPLPAQGRVFRARRRVRLSDAGPSGQLFLSACARYLQDIGNDDTADAGLDGEFGAWVVRRAVVELRRYPRWGEWLDLATWCAGTGRRWAERRLSITGEHGAAVEMTTLWIHLDPETLAPRRFPDSFMDVYGEAAGGRQVGARLWLDPPVDGASHQTLDWPLRAVDYDVMRHLNNAAYWSAVEEVLAREEHPLHQAPLQAVMEYGSGIPMGAEVQLQVDRKGQQVDLWFVVDGRVNATARLLPPP